MGKNSGSSKGGVQTPSLMLLALVSQFLANNGFNSSARIFNTERKKRPKKEGWMNTLGENYTAKMPALETIFKQWEETHTAEQDTESDSDKSSDDEELTSAIANDDSSSSDSESEAKELTPSRKVTAVTVNDNETSSSESDSESEDETVTKAPTAAVVANKSLKRKASESSSDASSQNSSDEASSESENESSEDDAPPAKKVKLQAPASVSESDSESDSDTDMSSSSSSESDSLEVAANTELPASESSSGSSSEESSEESSSDDDDVGNGAEVNGISNEQRAPSDSSGTITGEVKEAEPPKAAIEEAAVKKRHMGAHPTRLAQISAAADPDQFISNEYVSYEYADKAYRDLSVTRGKGFTKEKNKKKRGSYRGGPIDTSGGKGIKFDD